LLQDFGIHEEEIGIPRLHKISIETVTVSRIDFESVTVSMIELKMYWVVSTIQSVETVTVSRIDFESVTVSMIELTGVLGSVYYTIHRDGDCIENCLESVTVSMIELKMYWVVSTIQSVETVTVSRIDFESVTVSMMELTGVLGSVYYTIHRDGDCIENCLRVSDRLDDVGFCTHHLFQQCRLERVELH
jgi:CRISPR/Cas system endoribonuclease Cas6 (RAMP superfamily)